MTTSSSVRDAHERDGRILTEMVAMNTLLESLIAQRRNCHGSHGNGDHPHNPRCKRCKRCKRGHAVAEARTTQGE